MKNSECTPRGLHTIRACIGADFPDNTIFVGRRPTGELYSDALSAQLPERDWILTRILWLSGLEVGRNRLANVEKYSKEIFSLPIYPGIQAFQIKKICKIIKNYLNK